MAENTEKKKGKTNPLESLKPKEIQTMKRTYEYLGEKKNEKYSGK